MKKEIKSSVPADSEIILGILNDSKEILNRLYTTYFPMVLQLVLNNNGNEDDAKDAVQQIFLKSINELEKYEITYLKSWLYKVACNFCLMNLREKKNHKTYSEDTLSSLPMDDTEHAQIRELNLNTLEACLAALNIEQQSCITLFYLQKNSYQEITEKTGYSLLQVKSYVQNGKRNLKMLMEKKRKIE